MKLIISSALLLFISIIAPLHAQDKIGLVLMHGKSGTASDSSPVGELAHYLRSNNIIVISPDMPWHRERFLDKTYEDSMLEIDVAVKSLKSKGATKIIVGGHSMGANAAIGYGTIRDGLAGILAVAPGHVPDVGGYQKRIGHDWQRARDMVEAGKGKEKAEFKDRNQGENSEMEFTAEIYLSWYDPEGSAVMPDNVSALKPNTPLMWAVGTDDRMYERGEDYAFSEAPEHPKNSYTVVDGGHKATPEVAQEQILNWLISL